LTGYVVQQPDVRD